MTTERQLQYEQEKEEAKSILSARLGKNPTMMNVNKFIALRRRGVPDDQALEEVSRMREEKYKQTKKYAREQGLAVPITKKQAEQVPQSPETPKADNIESEFMKYYGNTISKVNTKTQKQRQSSVIPAELRNLSQKERMDFYRNIAANAYEHKYGKKPSDRVVSTMATMFNKGYTDEQIMNAVSGKSTNTTRKANVPVPAQNKQSAIPAELRNLSQKDRMDLYRNIAVNAYENKYGKKPSDRVVSTMATMFNKGYTDEQIMNAVSGKSTNTTRKANVQTQKPYNPFNEFNRNTRKRKNTRTTSSCELCKLEKSNSIRPEDKAIIDNIYQRYQPRTNITPSTVYPNPFNSM
jgi:hypothetical protein